MSRRSRRLHARGPPSPRHTRVPTNVGVMAEVIDIQTAREMWRLGDTVIDVRTPSEYANGHISGAINIPIDSLSAGFDALPEGQLLTTCGSGGRGGRAANLL